MKKVQWTFDSEAEKKMKLIMKPPSLFTGHFSLLAGWGVAILATTVYLLTLEPSVSFWDSGEFIATSYTLQVGHPPGAPLYTLLAHCFTLMGGDDPHRVAWWSNLLSAACGGFTAMFLFWTIARMVSVGGNLSRRGIVAAACGTACYLFCDTAWFSAVESEVYSLSMFFSSVILWAAVRSVQCEDRGYAPRWLLLIALLTGMSLAVHLMGFLVIPAVVLILLLFRKPKQDPSSQHVTHNNPTIRQSDNLKILPLAMLLFLVGLSPYAIIPIRAAADPPINMGHPSDCDSFRNYLSRSQYEKAPLLYGRCFNSPVVGIEDGKPVYAKEMDMFFPRMWKQHKNAELYYTDWTGRNGKMVPVGDREYYKPSFGDNLVIFFGYQLGYMYLRYLMWNFSGRYNDLQGFGNLQKGQFVTGIPFIDRMFIGTAAHQPECFQNKAHNRYFMLPLMLGIVGFFFLFRHNRKWAWVNLTLFLFSGVLLSVYLNHPLYEPRERDYAYILSFFSFSIWIAFGAYSILNSKLTSGRLGSKATVAISLLLLAVPALMAQQNWDDHDRSRRYIARDSAENLLNSCPQGSILFVLGDNETFPLWYLQEVEGLRTDVLTINTSLLGSRDYAMSTIKKLSSRYNLDRRQTYLSHPPQGSLGHIKFIMENVDAEAFLFSRYACEAYATLLGETTPFHNLSLCGLAYRYGNPSLDSVDCIETYRLMTEEFHWHSLDNLYIDEVSYNFLSQYCVNAILAAENLVDKGQAGMAITLLDTLCSQIPPRLMRQPDLQQRVAKAYLRAGDNSKYSILTKIARQNLCDQLAYYGTMKATMLQYIPYTLEPLLKMRDEMAISGEIIQK